MIVRSLPYDISVLILKCISLKVLYVSIFPRFFISLIAFVFSKIQNKKPFVKCFRRKADYSLNQCHQSAQPDFDNILYCS